MRRKLRLSIKFVKRRKSHQHKFIRSKSKQLRKKVIVFGLYKQNNFPPTVFLSSRPINLYNSLVLLPTTTFHVYVFNNASNFRCQSTKVTAVLVCSAAARTTLSATVSTTANSLDRLCADRIWWFTWIDVEWRLPHVSSTSTSRNERTTFAKEVWHEHFFHYIRKRFGATSTHNRSAIIL